MKLLYIAEGVPNRDAGRGDGSSMISYELIRHFPPEIAITLVTFTDGTPVPADVQQRCADVHVFPLRNFAVMAARSVLLGGSVGALQRDQRKADETVTRLSALADVSLLHGPHVTFLAHRVRGPMVLQVVDPWSARAGMEAEVATGWLKKYRTRQARQAAAAEAALPARARLLTVGRVDARRWSDRIGRSVGSIANGVDSPVQRVSRPAGQAPTVCFVGSLNYPPNVESAEVLVRDIAPQIWADLPDARFVLAGRHPVPSVLALAGDRVEVRGNVPSVQEVFQSADVAVFPDRHGLGIRNSVSEAMAAGTPVVASPVAAREQPENPLLHIGTDVDQLVALVREALAAPRSAGDPSDPAVGTAAGTGTAVRIRTWETAAQAYLAELRAAAAADR